MSKQRKLTIAHFSRKWFSSTCYIIDIHTVSKTKSSTSWSHSFTGTSPTSTALGTTSVSRATAAAPKQWQFDKICILEKGLSFRHQLSDILSDCINAINTDSINIIVIYTSCSRNDGQNYRLHKCAPSFFQRRIMTGRLQKHWHLQELHKFFFFTENTSCIYGLRLHP